MTVELRPYQQRAIALAREQLQSGVQRLLLNLATGAGKTVIAANIVRSAYMRGKRVVFVAHRRELIGQTLAKLVYAGLPSDSIGVLMGDDVRARPEAAIQIVSIATWIRREPPPADLVIIDECHRSLGPSYRRLIEHYAGAGARVLGMTATPIRADGRGLGEIFEAMIAVATPRELIADGFLVEPRVFSAPRDALPDLSGVRVQRGDYVEADLSRVMSAGRLVGGLVEHYQRLGDGQRGVVFAAGVAHSKSIAAAFVEAGIAAEHLDGNTPTPERDAILARLESGETRVVSNCGVLTEGWDQPAVKVCILARPTKSPALYLQMAGRVLRPWQGVGALVLDHAGNALEHGLPHADREWSLHVAASPARGKAAPVARACEFCNAIASASAEVCPECGAPFPVRARLKSGVRKVAPGQLVELSDEAVIARAALEARIAEERRQRGLCSPKQSEQLRRRGLNPNCSAEDAKVAMTAIATNGWRTPGWLKADPRFGRPAHRSSAS